MSDQSQRLTPSADCILREAHKAIEEDFASEIEFLLSFSQKVLAESPDREPGIGAAISEIVVAGRWPWRTT